MTRRHSAYNRRRRAQRIANVKLFCGLVGGTVIGMPAAMLAGLVYGDVMTNSHYTQLAMQAVASFFA